MLVYLNDFVQMPLTSSFFGLIKSFGAQIVRLDDGGMDDDEGSRNSGDLDGV